MTAALPPRSWWPLAIVSVVLYALATTQLTRRHQQAIAGGVFALVWFAPAMQWMWFLTAPGYVVAIVVFASFHAIAAAAAPSGRWSTIGRPAAHTLAEVIRLSFPFGGVPLANVGLTQVGGPLLAVARVGGVIALTWLVFQTGFSLAAMVESKRTTSSPAVTPRLAFSALGVVVVVIVAGLVAPRGRDHADPLTIAAVQGGGEQGTHALDVPASEVFAAHLAATSTISPSDGIDVVVWPENGIDVNDAPFDGSSAYDAITAEADRLGVPFTVGITIDSEFSQHPVDGHFVNAQVIVTPTGEITGVYEKVKIVPFGEYAPFRDQLAALGAPMDLIPLDAIRGQDPSVLTLPDGTTMGVVISWEVFFGDRGREAGAGHLIINPTNGSSYTGTTLQNQQVASSKLRAVENGRWVIQASPTGYSGFIDPSGRLVDRSEIGERRVMVGKVTPRSGLTWYRALGDRPWQAAVVAVLAWSLWAHRRRESTSATGSGAELSTWA